MEWGLENENHLTKVQSDVIDLSHIQKHLDGTVRISFDDSRFTFNDKGYSTKSFQIKSFKIS